MLYEVITLIAEGDGQDRKKALRMASTLWPDPIDLRQVVGDGNLAVLFRYAVRTRNTDAATVFWSGLSKDGAALSQKEIAAFIQLLIDEKRLDLATTIWRQRINPEALVYNGTFSYIPLQTAFGWRISTAKGSSWRIEKPDLDRSPPALSLRFLHQENLSFQLV